MEILLGDEEKQVSVFRGLRHRIAVEFYVQSRCSAIGFIYGVAHRSLPKGDAKARPLGTSAKKQPPAVPSSAFRIALRRYIIRTRIGVGLGDGGYMSVCTVIAVFERGKDQHSEHSE